MKTLDLRKINSPDSDKMRIAIRVERKQDYNELKLLIPGDDKFRLVDIGKSLRYACHAPDFAWGYSGDGPKQLALAICLELYSVSDAVRYHKRFAIEFLEDLDQRARLIVTELVVPIKPDL